MGSGNFGGFLRCTKDDLMTSWAVAGMQSPALVERKERTKPVRGPTGAVPKNCGDGNLNKSGKKVLKALKHEACSLE